jgi:hypothetical protein
MGGASFLTFTFLVLVPSLIFLIATSQRRIAPQQRVMGVNALGGPVYDPTPIPVVPRVKRFEWGMALGSILPFSASAGFYWLKSCWSWMPFQVVCWIAAGALMIYSYALVVVAWENRFLRPPPGESSWRPSRLHVGLALFIILGAIAGLAYGASADGFFQAEP